MNIRDVTNYVGISFDRLVERTGIPASTLSDIMSGRSDLSRCQARTLQKLANGLELSIEDLLDLEAFTQDLPAPSIRPVHKLIAPHAFIFFRNSMLYFLDRLGEKGFIKFVMEKKVIEDAYSRDYYPEALYMIGLIDYLCDKNEMPRMTRYDIYRGETMNETIFAQSARINPMVDYSCSHEVIPQIMKFNFIETPETLKQYL